MFCLARRSARFLLLVAIVAPFFVGYADARLISAQESEVLQIGDTSRGEIRGGATKRFKFLLSQGAHAKIVIQQQRIILLATLRDSALNQLLQIDNPAGGNGPIYISVIARSSGDYFIDLESTERWANAGQYEISIREATPTEVTAEQVSSERAFADARRQYKEGKKESREAAILNYQRALDYWKQTSEPHWLAMTLYSLGVTYRRLGELKTANDFFDRSLEVATGPEDWRIKASCLNDRGLNLQELGNFPLAFESHQESLRLYNAHDDRRGRASALNNLGLAYHRSGQLEQAMKNYEEALPLRRAESDQGSEFNVLNNIGAIYDVAGEPQKALDYYAATLKVWQELDSRNQLTNRDQLASAFNNVAEIYDKLGEPQKALEGYEQAVRIVRETGNKQREAIILDNLGELRHFLGDLPTAVADLTRALQLLESARDPEVQGNVLVHLGETYFSQEQFVKARQLFEKAMDVRRTPRGRAIAMARLGSVSAAMHENSQADDLYFRALRLSVEASDTRTEAWILHKQGELKMSTGQGSSALSEFEQALTKWRALNDPRGEASTLNRIALVQYSLNNLDKAATYSRDAIRIVESTRGRVPSQQLRTAYFAIQQNYYDLDIQIQMKLYRATGSATHLEAAFGTSERARARSLLDTLAEADAGLRTAIDDNLLSEKRELRRRLNAKADRLVLLSNLPERAKERATLEKELSELVAKSSEIEARIRARNPKYAQLVESDPIHVADVKNLLDDGTLLLEFFLGEPQSFVWAISANGIDAFDLPSRNVIERAARSFYDVISSQEKASSKFAAQYTDAANQLSSLLMAPISDLIKNKRVVIVADGVLQYIPFAPLTAKAASGTSVSKADSLGPGSFGNGDFVYMPSASVLRLQRRDVAKRKAPTNVLAIFADPVYDREDSRVAAAQQSPKTSIATMRPTILSVQPNAEQSRSHNRAYDETLPEGISLNRLSFSREEANSIVATVRSGKVLQAVGFSANLTTASDNQLSEYRIVHFATHAIIDGAHPELSALVLSRVDAAGQHQDGFLRLHDIYDLHLNADIVVLSACQTALGREVKGEGLISLTRGFMYAGAKRVVASLWKVDDSATAALMAQFYKEMFSNGRRPPEALKEAQIHISNQKRWRSPYYWAGFVLQGEWR